MAQDCLREATLPVPLTTLVLGWLVPDRKAWWLVLGSSRTPFTIPGYMPDAPGFVDFPLQAV